MCDILNYNNNSIKGSVRVSQFTKRAIMSAFTQLLNEMPLNKIRVKDIAEMCEINRNTFYYYYQDIYSLLDDVFKEETAKVISENNSYDSWIEGFRQCIEFAIGNRKAIYHIYNSMSREQLERYLNQVTEYFLTNYIRKEAQGLDVSESDIRQVVLFYKFALVGLVLEWLQRGMSDDADAYISRMGFLLEGNIRKILEKAAENQA
jgi:probable dihydroxyacetone kinase regulator